MSFVGRAGVVVVGLSVAGCPQGEMAPANTAGASGTATDGDASGSSGTGRGTADETATPDGDGSGGGTMGNSPVAVTCGDVPDSAVGASYSHTATAVGGDGNYDWSASGLPEGLEIDGGDGEITGAPSTSGSFEVVLTATDNGGLVGEGDCTLVVNEALGVEPPAAPLAEQACVSGDGSLLDLIIDGTGDGSPVECSFEAGNGNGRLPDGITVDPETCRIEGTLESDRFGVYAFIVRGEQHGVSVYAPYCVTQTDEANAYAVDVDHSGATSVPLVPIVRFFDPRDSVSIGGNDDPVYSVVDASVCLGSNACFFGFSFSINASPFDSRTFDVIDAALLSDDDDERIGMTHGLTVSAASIDRAFHARPWIQNATMRYCLSVVGADCSSAPAVADNGGGELEISIIMFPQAR
ncbi:MAG: putative Ig domain-containing protein [Nannocystaceae bacterium]|nr:putative Ig domain-containing protein [Nannocystaceae bacterium]